MGNLTALRVKHAKAGRHSDGKGLYLLVKPTGGRSWVLRVQVGGRRRDFGLGSADMLSLEEAREKALIGRRMAKTGLDPAFEWKKGRHLLTTFEQAARQFHTHVSKGWKNGKHGAQWLSTLEAHVFPAIGGTSVDHIDAAAIQAVLLPIWLTVPETARRVRQRIGAVLDFAHSQGWRATEAPMRAVAKGLPRQPKQSGHFSAMPYAAVPAFIAKLRDAETSMGRLALLFTVFTAARSGEVRGATWRELDLDRAQWNIPAGRMKAGEAHSIPLSGPALDVLHQARRRNGAHADKPLFPGLRGKPLSDMTLAKALRVAGGEGFTVHGFRSSFRDWVAERTSFPGEWAEAALAHSLPNRVEAAYRRTKFVEQRQELMAEWGNFVSGGSGTVVSMALARA